MNPLRRFHIDDTGRAAAFWLSLGRHHKKTYSAFTPQMIARVLLFTVTVVSAVTPETDTSYQSLSSDTVMVYGELLFAPAFALKSIVEGEKVAPAADSVMLPVLLFQATP